MKLVRRELLSKCMALGVVTTTANLLPATIAAAWAQAEKPHRTPTPQADLGPFYEGGD